MVRILHLSDIHIHEPQGLWRAGQLFSKHFTGWVNWRVLRRGRRFAEARPALERFMARVREDPPDVIVFSGDASALGFASEVQQAAKLLCVDAFQGVTIPGNHDYYTPRTANSGVFEEAFAPWLQGLRIDNAQYPFARDIAGVWFVCVNSAVPNRGILDASGLVGAAQLNRLDRLFAQLPDGPRVLVTHYPFCTAEGLPESHHHGLRDRDELAAIVKQRNVKLWLCGHRHRSYQFGPTDECPFQIVCAGSATQSGTMGWWEIDLSRKHLVVTRAS